MGPHSYRKRTFPQVRFKLLSDGMSGGECGRNQQLRPTVSCFMFLLHGHPAGLPKTVIFFVKLTSVSVELSLRPGLASLTA